MDTCKFCGMDQNQGGYRSNANLKEEVVKKVKRPFFNYNRRKMIAKISKQFAIFMLGIIGLLVAFPGLHYLGKFTYHFLGGKTDLSFPESPLGWIFGVAIVITIPICYFVGKFMFNYIAEKF